MPERIKTDKIIPNRYKEINNFENYLYNNGIKVVKIFLNVSKEEQAKRFISRIDIPKKNWKISENDIKEREYWDKYQEAFETMVNKTATAQSPWYVVPADKKWYARFIVSEIILKTLKEINPKFPVIKEERIKDIKFYKEQLQKNL